MYSLFYAFHKLINIFAYFQYGFNTLEDVYYSIMFDSKNYVGQNGKSYIGHPLLYKTCCCTWK